MYESLNGKVALVTGGGSGIGRATSLAFARHGCKVVVSDMNGPGGLETVKLILETGGEAIFIPTNVTLASQVEALVRRTVARFGSLDCAVNNAGVNVASRNPTHLYSEDDWDRIIDVNLRGVWLSMKYEIPVMLKPGSRLDSQPRIHLRHRRRPQHRGLHRQQAWRLGSDQGRRP